MSRFVTKSEFQSCIACNQHTLDSKLCVNLCHFYSDLWFWNIFIDVTFSFNRQLFCNSWPVVNQIHDPALLCGNPLRWNLAFIVDSRLSAYFVCVFPVKVAENHMLGSTTSFVSYFRFQIFPLLMQTLNSIFLFSDFKLIPVKVFFVNR